MDGASKFVRGDAVAGLLVVFINIVGGIIIGGRQQGLSFSEAARSYTLLTVGDGLVTQVPALIVSTAAGPLCRSGRLRAADTGADQAILRLSAGARHVGPASCSCWRCCRASRHSVLALASRRRRDDAWRPQAQACQDGRRCAPPQRAGRRPPQPLPRRKRSPRRSRSTISRSKWATRCCRCNGPDGTDRLTEQIKALRRSLRSRWDS